MLYGAVEAGARVMDFGTKFSDKPASERSVDNGSLRRVVKGGDAMLLSPGGFPDAQLRSGSLVFDDESNMLSFSSAVGAGDEKTAKNAAFQSYSPESAGLGIARTLNSANMQVPFAGATQLFTQSQWFELEQQALIYKYIAANVSVPSNLITPIRRSFNPWASASILANGSLSSTSYGWGPFRLGFPGSTDPEPGRCRRTDGKKWRCAKDATHGHKYCEKHLNRGRHRSRKPVEGQKPDHSVTVATSFAKVATLASSLSKTSEEASGSGALALADPLHQSKRSHLTLNPFADSLTRRAHDDLHGISVLSPTISLDSKDALFSIPKPKDPFEESYQSAFGNIPSDYLRNPYQTMSSPSLNGKGFHPQTVAGIRDQESQDQQLLRQFVEYWPKERSEHSSISWQEEAKPDWTKLSMSIPVASSGFSSSTSSPINEKLALSPLRLGLEFSQREMGFSLGKELNESTYMLSSPWGSSAGGPLGEVLKISSTQQPLGINENPSALSLMKFQGWDSGKAPIEPSPTGVLLKSTFGSLSTSSSGSSPKVETKVPCSTTLTSLYLP